MSQTITVPTKTIEEILTRLDRLTREIKAIKTKLFEEEPPYGSDEWWEKEIEEGLEEVKKRKVSGPFKKTGELLKTLHQEADL